jgi:uncharacterized phiE125 gp8 family phage protein
MVKVITPAAAEPLSLADAKLHLKVDFDADDALITGLIAAARQMVEQYTDLVLIDTVLEEALRGFPPDNDRVTQGRDIVLTKSPVQSVASISYTNADGNAQTVDLADTVLDNYSKPARIWPTGNEWPVTREGPASVKVRYTAGYGAAADVPSMIKQAMLLLIGDWYDNREDGPRRFPQASKSLLDLVRIQELG